MDKRFEDAVDVVKTHLETNQYCYSTTRHHLRCYLLLSKFLACKRKPYSECLANQWFGGIASGLCGTTVNTYKQALMKLDAAYHHKNIGSTKAQYDLRQKYQRLVPWCKTLLDTFLTEMSGLYGCSYLKALRIAAIQFLNYAIDKGGNRPQDITHRLIADYYHDDENTSRKSKDAYNRQIRKFLHYLSDKGIIQASIYLTLDKFVLQRLIFIESLTDSEQNAFRVNSDGLVITEEVYYAKALEMTAIIDLHKYSKSQRKVFFKAWRELFVFLEANSLNYSIIIALAWVNYMRRFTAQWKSFRRAMMLFEQFRTSGQINPQKVYTYGINRTDVLPAWCKEDYEAFYRLKAKEGLTKSTLDMYRSSCLRLLEYLHKSGINSWEAVKAETLKAFHRQDRHFTPEGKNAYSSKLRIFLEYLGDTDKVSPTLYMAVPSESAPRVSIIRTLNDDEIADLYRFQQHACGALEMRDKAIILIGLRMGLRASDIVKIKYSDISWEQKTLSIKQQKTGKFLKLPIPTEVGNALCRYIIQGRSDALSEYIFISHRVLYKRLHPSACGKALKNALPGKSIGFHVTRKTFASRMLVNNVVASRITETLGHASNSSVMPYLSTNNDNMRMCALSLAGIPVKGGFLS